MPVFYWKAFEKGTYLICVPGSGWLTDPSNKHGKDMLLNGKAPRHGQIMKMPKLALTFKVIEFEFYFCMLVLKYMYTKSYHKNSKYGDI